MSKEGAIKLRPRLAGLIGLACLTLGEALAGEKVAGTLSVRDGLTMPGRPVMIEATLVQDTLLRQAGIGGELVEFLVGGKKAGTSMTGGDGRARLQYTPHMRGNQTVTAKLAESKRVQSPEAAGTLFVWERRRPVLLVEFAALTEPAKNPVVAIPPLAGKLTGQPSPTPLPEAADELKRLADFFFNVTYVSRTGVAMSTTEAQREWLRQHSFPSGFLVDIKPDKAALGTVIEELRDQGWDNLKSGVGRTKDFADVLVEHRIMVVIVPEPERGDLPKKAQVAKGWKEVRKKLQG